MRILIVAATERELDGVAGESSPAGHHLDLLITGVGMVATAARTARALAQKPYDLAFNFGVCGSFDPALEIGRAVHIVKDRIAELGAEDDDAFLTLDQLGLPGDSVFVNAAAPASAALAALPAVSAITVNTAHGNARTIAAAVRRFEPQVESMEGAGFMCACQLSGVRYAQVRAVSNVVEKRNREAWNLGEAVGQLRRAARSILESL
jgi:futalosine hydrolase